MKSLKKIVFAITSLSFLYAENNFNINLTIPMATGTLPQYKQSLPQYKTATNMQPPMSPIMPNQKKQTKKINTNQEKQYGNVVVGGNTITANNVKVVTSNVIDDLNSTNPYNNICQAFVVDNSNNAFDYGYKEGVKYTKLYIGKFLIKHKKSLDILFPLKQLYLDNGILQPPLIKKEDKGSYIYDNGNVYRQFGVKYYIASPAKFVTKNSYKKWEDFLLDYPIDYYKNTPIKNVLNFQMNIRYSNNAKCNKKIKEAVYKKFREGFKAGEKEVFLLMSTRLKKLQDFLDGLYLYNELYYRGIINPPLISEFIEPVYKKENGRILVINEKVLKIVKPATFNTQTKKWKVYLITNDKITTIHLTYKKGE